MYVDHIYGAIGAHSALALVQRSCEIFRLLLLSIDAMHDSNEHTVDLLVRDDNGCCLPVPCILVQSQHASHHRSLQSALQWSGHSRLIGWHPRWVIADSSASGQLGFVKWFDGFGVQQLLCQKHVQDLITKKFSKLAVLTSTSRARCITLRDHKT